MVLIFFCFEFQTHLQDKKPKYSSLASSVRTPLLDGSSSSASCQQKGLGPSSPPKQSHVVAANSEL